MRKIEYFEKVRELLTSSRAVKILYLVAFTLLITTIIASQNFFFQSIIDNGISKKDVVAQKTITVEDVKRTEQHRREVAQKVEPILVPAEDEFIKTNLETLQKSIIQIRKKDKSEKEKIDELNILFDFSDNSKRNFVIDFFLHVDDASLKEAFDKSTMSLVNILQKGITEDDYERNNMKTLIQNNLVSNVSKRQISVITALLEQVIVPNLVVDETATENAKIKAQEAVKPYTVTFQKNEKILFEGEPVTRLKRDALRAAGYNVYELNWQGILSVYILVLLVTVIFLGYLKFFEKTYLEPRFMSLSGMLVALTCLTAVVLPTGSSPYILPIPAVIMIAAIFLSPRIAFLLSTLFTTSSKTSFSSLNLLSEIPVDLLKIDRGFIFDIMTNKANQMIVKAVTTCADDLDIDVCVEGLEDQSMIDFMKAYHTHSYQGYFFSRPIPMFITHA